MASASSLLGLVSQLQSMESSFAAILFEAAMKLSSLTDAKVFLMVESPEGRSWAGHPILRHTFLHEGLHPQEEDTEIEVDPNVSAIVRRKKMAQSLQQEHPLYSSGLDAEDPSQQRFMQDAVSQHSDVEPDSPYDRPQTNYQRKRRLESQLSQHGSGVNKHSRGTQGRRVRKAPRGSLSSSNSLDADFRGNSYQTNHSVEALHEVGDFPSGESQDFGHSPDLLDQQSQPRPDQQQLQRGDQQLQIYGQAFAASGAAETFSNPEAPGFEGFPGGDSGGSGPGEVPGFEAENGGFEVDDVFVADTGGGGDVGGGGGGGGGGKKRKKLSDKSSWALVPTISPEDKYKFSLGIPDVLSDAAYLYPSGRISGKGTRPKAMWKGWRYSFHSESSIRNVMLFNCSHRQQNKCKGQITVNRDSLQVVGHKLHDFDVSPDVEATLQEIDEKELLAGFK